MKKSFDISIFIRDIKIDIAFFGFKYILIVIFLFVFVPVLFSDSYVVIAKILLFDARTVLY